MELPNSPSPFVSSTGPLRNTNSVIPLRRSSSRLRPYPSPLAGALPWTAARQSHYESLVTRLTASANFPLSWVDNPIWIEFCDEFLPSAKVPTRRVLTSRLLHNEIKHFRAQAIQQTAGGDATMQADGWTGLNNHHLLAFMIRANCAVHTACVLNTSQERKTANKFLEHIEEVIKHIKTTWQVEHAAFTSDASGESRAARIMLLAKYAYLIVLDCYAHQVSVL
ncbi:hypothetical protein BC628DRAFT_1317586 [Trametes gibbosa]|nr:hypothetical protein BC628DRAFT_1317586 [Trametes gibbosa]